MNNEKRYIPASARRYSINELGSVFDSDDKEIKSYLKDDEYYVDLEWIYGRRPYLVALLCLVTYKTFSIPDYLYNKIEPIYIDEDSSNFSLVNLSYKFKDGPLEIPDRPGFYFIPFFSKYGINKSGVLVNLETGKIKSWTVSKPYENNGNRKRGYSFTSLSVDVGSKHSSKHRLLCLAFKEYKKSPTSLIVNHKDGEPSNNDLDNLEWCTYKENSEHAYATGLQVGASREVLVKNLKTNEVKSFISLRACYREMNLRNYQYVAKRIRNNNRFFKDGLCFKYDDGTEWPILDLSNKNNYYREQVDREVIARNVFTGDLYIFTSSRECSKDTGIRQEEINRSIRDSQVIPINGYNFQYLDDLVEWPVHSFRHLQIYKKYPFHPRNGLIALDTDTNEELFFTRVSEALDYFKITRVTFYHYLQEKRKFNNKYLFSLFKLPENQGHPTE